MKKTNKTVEQKHKEAPQNVDHFYGLAQDCSISIAKALKTLQSCTKPAKWSTLYGACLCFCSTAIDLVES